MAKRSLFLIPRDVELFSKGHLVQFINLSRLTSSHFCLIIGFTQEKLTLTKLSYL